MLHPVDTGHTVDLPEPEKEIKHQFVQESIDNTLNRIADLDPNRFSGGIAYMLLYTFYKLDYLIQPEGFMMETLERGHRIYFAHDNRPVTEKSDLLRKELEELKKRTKEEFFKEMYRVKSTFGITNPVNHDRVVSFIDGEIGNMDWYHDHKYPDIAVSVPGYIAGYCLFNYAVPQPDRELLHLLIETLESEFFKKLGFTAGYYDPKSQKFDKSAIKREINSIVRSNIKQFPKLDPDTGSLSYDSLPDFSKSFMMMVRNLDLTPANNKKF